MLAPTEAQTLIFDNLSRYAAETCPIGAAQGRVLRTDIRADRELPPFDRVTMDGYALRGTSIAAGTRVFRVEGLQAAGAPASRLSAATDACIEVMTGAVLPEGADAVVPYEETKREGSSVILSDSGAALRGGNAVHRRGSDRTAGEIIVRTGTRLTGREIAVAAACGYGTLSVSRLPNIAVVATGDELVEVESAPAAHQIRRSNDYAICAALASAGYPDTTRFLFRDVREEIAESLRQILAAFDVVVICGGVSKGKFDHLPVELERNGVRLVLHGVAQRPGKPFWFGMGGRPTAVFALPGNPVSAYTCLHRYVVPALARASGVQATPSPTVGLSAAVRFKPPLTYFLPVKLSSGMQAERLATPVPSNTSGDFAGLLDTDGFVELPPGPCEFPIGTVAPFWPWR